MTNSLHEIRPGQRSWPNEVDLVQVDFRQIVRSLEQCEKSEVGKCSCRLAQLIWIKEIDSEDVIQLLANGSERVRSSVSWAVSDFFYDFEAIDVLVTDRLFRDELPAVRGYSLLAISKLPRHARYRKLVVDVIVDDPGPEVRKMARELVVKLDSKM